MTTEGIGQVPPHDLDAEQRVLGGMLAERPGVIGDVAAVITSRDYYRGAHQHVHEAIMALYEGGHPAGPVAVADYLTRHGLLARAGGGPYLHTLMASVVVPEQAGYYARIVRERAILRRIIEAGTRLVQFGYSPDGDADEIAARARAEVDDATAGTVAAEPLRSMRGLVYDALDSVERGTERGLSLPWRDLTQALNGIAPGQLIYVAARPKTGKSIVGAQIAAHVALKLGRAALLVSMEMRAEEITMRLISGKARVPLTSLLNRTVTEADWNRLRDAAGPVAESKLVIEDSFTCGPARIRSRLREMARTHPAAVLVVDYLGLMETSARAENRQNAVAALSRELKQIAGEFAIPVVCLAQLNRGPEHRTDKRPVASDLRDSGAQEQDADVVILLHREDAYNPESPRAGEIDFIVAVNRTGPPCTVTAAFQGHYARVVDMARVGQVPGEEWEASA